MKRFVPLLLAAFLSVVTPPVQAQDNKVVVIPLNSGSGGPGDWKHVSVSSLGGIPRNSEIVTGVSYNCGDAGRYAESTIGYEFLTVPIQLPDGATIISLTGLICDTRADYLGEMLLKRSDDHNIAQVITGINETSPTTLTKTTSNITEGLEIVDNSKYTYFIYMSINGNAGSAVYPVGAIVTLE